VLDSKNPHEPILMVDVRQLVNVVKGRQRGGQPEDNPRCALEPGRCDLQ